MGNSKEMGHLWDADGLQSTVSSDTGDKTYYIHFDWGWQGNCNGYYAEGVFSVRNYAFKAMYFSSVRGMISD